VKFLVIGFDFNKILLVIGFDFDKPTLHFEAFTLYLVRRRASCSSCSACCCLHSLNACLASCSYLCGGLPPASLLPSFSSFKNISANAPIRNADTSVRVARSAQTRTKHSPIIRSPKMVVLGFLKIRSISIFLL